MGDLIKMDGTKLDNASSLTSETDYLEANIVATMNEQCDKCDITVIVRVAEWVINQYRDNGKIDEALLCRLEKAIELFYE